jgi:predicted GH43/DUF377 family glycosyl hydrolase
MPAKKRRGAKREGVKKKTAAKRNSKKALRAPKKIIRRRSRAGNGAKRKLPGELKALGVFRSRGRLVIFLHDAGDRNHPLLCAISENGIEFRIERQVSFGRKRNVKISRDAWLAASEDAESGDAIIALHLGKKTLFARTRDFVLWRPVAETKNFPPQGVLAPLRRTHHGYVAYASERGAIRAAASPDLKRWKTLPGAVCASREEHFDRAGTALLGVVKHNDGPVMLYKTISPTAGLCVGMAVLDPENPARVMYRTAHPIWQAPEGWEKKSVRHIGTVEWEDMLSTYWDVEGEGILLTSYPYPTDFSHSAKVYGPLRAAKHPRNPIITPRGDGWESLATFNPAALYEDGKVHILYRAMGPEWVSVLGYASSRDGVTVEERPDYPAFVPTAAFDTVSGEFPMRSPSGGGYGGCEDPRLTRFGNRIYLTYVAYDGANPPRVALTWINRKDFLEQRWLWARPVLISPPGVVNKNACILPEKIGGKYVIFHRVFPDILIDFVDDLDFDGETKWLAGHYRISPRPDYWDSRKIGAGAPPLKTNKGWLLIYQGLGNQDPSRYKIGAMLLDLRDPVKVLYRSKHPIIEPAEWYENEGHKFGVVYPCGATVVHGTLFIYYGGADKVTCVASAPLQEFLRDLVRGETPTLRPVAIDFAPRA